MGRSHTIDRTGYATFDALAAMRDEIEASAAYFSESLSLGRGPGARRLETVAHSGGYFAVLGLQPEIGSWAEASNTPREDVAVISYALWQQEFGGSRDVLGKPLRLGLDTYTIVAVAARGLRASKPRRPTSGYRSFHERRPDTEATGRAKRSSSR